MSENPISENLNIQKNNNSSLKNNSSVTTFFKPSKSGATLYYQKRNTNFKF